jgi:hypothetical protein
MKYRHINIIGCITIICIVILLYLVFSKRVEAFDDTIPAPCGKYGFALPSVLVNNIPDLKGADSLRFYTDKECTTLGGKTNFFGKTLQDSAFFCQERNPENTSQILKDYSRGCGGLNKQYTPPPADCKQLGVPLVGLSGDGYPTLPFKDLSELNGVFRNYTRQDCDELGGQFYDKSNVDSKSPYYPYMSNIGICISKKNFIPYNIACAGLNNPRSSIPVTVEQPSFVKKLVKLVKDEL